MLTLGIQEKQKQTQILSMQLQIQNRKIPIETFCNWLMAFNLTKIVEIIWFEYEVEVVYSVADIIYYNWQRIIVWLFSRTAVSVGIFHCTDRLFFLSFFESTLIYLNINKKQMHPEEKLRLLATASSVAVSINSTPSSTQYHLYRYALISIKRS